ncbi:hypothetical protein CFC21_060570 [Triticum aestivum]|uniref:J domain-containing protein n=1 Tax=Triticum aestivum TaxID=4565 RepID=A0A9R1KFR9_WHEAT|nr:hypothetical protein CFC21_060570 [Triticum aestivum]
MSSRAGGEIRGRWEGAGGAAFQGLGAPRLRPRRRRHRDPRVGHVRKSVDWFYTQQRIRHMQSVFNRERNKFRKSYESWKENGPPGGYNYIPRDDWYWQSDTPNSENKNRRTYTPAGPRGYPMSHHYTVLGLDRSRGTPYTDAEVKNAFRTKAMEVHPDQNQDNRETAEEEFKEVVKSYEAIKLERKNNAS